MYDIYWHKMYTRGRVEVGARPHNLPHTTLHSYQYLLSSGPSGEGMEGASPLAIRPIHKTNDAEFYLCVELSVNTGLITPKHGFKH